MIYKHELIRAMDTLARNPKTLFIGQSVRYGGQAMSPTLAGVPMERRIELPVSEDLQMGFCTGLALEGFIPVCIFTRFDFMLLAMNQLVNHLDKLPILSEFNPKVIIRVAVGTDKPINPGPQHTQNHSDALRMMLKTVCVTELLSAEQICPAYEHALDNSGSYVLVEHMSKYNNG